MRKRLFFIMMTGIIAFLFNFLPVQAQTVRLAEVNVPPLVNTMQLIMYKAYSQQLTKYSIVVQDPVWISKEGAYRSYFGKSANKTNGFALFYTDSQNYLKSVLIETNGHSNTDYEMAFSVLGSLLGALGTDEDALYGLVGKLMANMNGADKYSSTTSTSAYAKSLGRCIDVNLLANKDNSLVIMVRAHK